MLEREITISNKLGLHARASAKLVQELHGFQASAFIACRGREVNAKSIMGVMMLAAGKGSKITLEVAGPDEAQAMEALCTLVSDCFGEGQ